MILLHSEKRYLFLLLSILASMLLAGSNFQLATASDAEAGFGSMDYQATLASGKSRAVLQDIQDRELYYTAYQVKKGDTFSELSNTFNITFDSIISINRVTNARSLRPGNILKIPSISGIVYTASKAAHISDIADQYKISKDRIIQVNKLLSLDIKAGTSLFLPDARLAAYTLRQISGDLFQWPLSGYITSYFGWRRDPFTQAQSFHNGLDIGVRTGTPVRVAMEGVVTTTGYSSGSGNFVIVAHHDGWSTFYGHLQTIGVITGQGLARGQRLGTSGNTGRSTGPHLHFTVFKYGKAANPLNFLH